MPSAGRLDIGPALIGQAQAFVLQRSATLERAEDKGHIGRMGRQAARHGELEDRGLDARKMPFGIVVGNRAHRALILLQLVEVEDEIVHLLGWSLRQKAERQPHPQRDATKAGGHAVSGHAQLALGHRQLDLQNLCRLARHDPPWPEAALDAEAFAVVVELEDQLVLPRDHRGVHHPHVRQRQQVPFAEVKHRAAPPSSGRSDPERRRRAATRSGAAPHARRRRSAPRSAAHGAGR